MIDVIISSSTERKVEWDHWIWEQKSLNTIHSKITIVYISNPKASDVMLPVLNKRSGMASSFYHYIMSSSTLIYDVASIEQKELTTSSSSG
jgi:hypothetical protein